MNWHLLTLTALAAFTSFTLVAAPVPKALPADADAESKRGRELLALERKLFGEWKGGPCAGTLFFYPDGTFERKNYGPGGIAFEGTWKLKWDALPPTLEMTVSEKDQTDFSMIVKLVKLDGETLQYQFDTDDVSTPFSRVKR